MRPYRFFFNFTKSQRAGIFALFIVICIIQASYFIITSRNWESPEEVAAEEQQWLALQEDIDKLKSESSEKQFTIYPFNPNFISDHKGYTLGMTTAEIDRLHKFREKGSYINTVKDFQEVTKVSDSLLAVISPYFKFPDWATEKQSPTKHPDDKNEIFSKSLKKNAVALLDINQAIEEELDEVYGIGPVFAKKILRRRAQLGGFVSMEQMEDFKEFSPEAIAGLKKSFTVVKTPGVIKININTASLNQLSYFPYFNKSIARAIITHRSMKGKIVNIEELLEINDFPVEKVKIITLYLEF